ncbi:MAG: hypothetical protein AAF682_20190 [Planctomycetota bacterium]
MTDTCRFLLRLPLLATACFLLTSLTAGQNLLTNGDAEQADLTGWTASPEVYVTASQSQSLQTVTPFEGNFFFSLAAQPGTSGSMIQGGTSGLTASSLVLSGRFQVEYTDEGEGIIRLFENDTLLTSATTGRLSGRSEVWIPFSVAVSVPPQTTRWEVELAGFLMNGSFVNTFYDGVVLESADCPAVAATETARAGTPPNPNALFAGVTSGPVLGQVWDPFIDHTAFLPSASFDFLAITATSLNVDLGALGTLLCDPSSTVSIPSVAAGAPFAVSIPSDCMLAGLSFCSQGASLDALGSIRLTNALDITVGTF